MSRPRPAQNCFLVFAKDGESLFRGETGSSNGGSAPAVPVGVGGEGDVIARVDGFVIFVADTNVGDDARVQIDKVMRRFAIGHKV